MKDRDIKPDTNTSESARLDLSPLKPTLGEELRLKLADDIVSGFLLPGAILDESELARRFNVSRTPVREAIRLLAASGLVDAKPHRSALVASPGPERLHAMFETMAELESVCAGLSAERMTASERQNLEDLHEQLRLLTYAGNPERYHEINEQLHGALYVGSHNSFLADLTVSTRRRVQPFRRAQFRNVGRLKKSQVEHDRVVQAILRGARIEASEAMRDHINQVHGEYENYAKLT
jgi:DNA-binding GntR family transcriptional regulator